tara:strand:- start:126 stop:512 length:387 start_codon:yes stop_codon:yes gene_type:complete
MILPFLFKNVVLPYNVVNICTVNEHIFIKNSKMKYFLLGVLAPIMLNLIHLGVGLFVTKNQGNTYGVGFSAIGFISKTAGMVFLTWLGVSYLELDFKIYIPLLTFFWFISHIFEAFVLNNAMKKNIDK